ncbi:hypothetical protein ACFVTY_30205 [Streptomyces sp. NPDC058067]|uniref:hypothetical protein n=1 Tax=Streptomyces sp. NPDC058067 TaxID=3346324 RepID=UPI0036E3EAA8
MTPVPRRQRRRIPLGGLAAALVVVSLGASGCSGSAGRDAGGDGKQHAVPVVKAEGKTLTVWVMDGTTPRPRARP